MRDFVPAGLRPAPAQDPRSLPRACAARLPADCRVEFHEHGGGTAVAFDTSGEVFQDNAGRAQRGMGQGGGVRRRRRLDPGDDADQADLRHPGGDDRLRPCRRPLSTARTRSTSSRASTRASAPGRAFWRPLRRSPARIAPPADRPGAMRCGGRSGRSEPWGGAEMSKVVVLVPTRCRQATATNSRSRRAAISLTIPTGPDAAADAPARVFGGKYMTDWRRRVSRELVQDAKLAPSSAIRASTSSGWMPASRYPSGAPRAGCIRTTRAAGSNGIAATISAAAWRRMRGRSNAGRPCAGTSGRSSATASRATSSAAAAAPGVAALGL